MNKIKKRMTNNAFDLALIGLAGIGFTTVVLIYKKHLDNIGVEMLKGAYTAGFSEMCGYLKQEGYNDVLDKLIEKGLVVKV